MQCSQILKSGKKCSRKIKFGSYCWQHDTEEKETFDESNLKLLIINYLNTSKKLELDTEALDALQNIFIHLYLQFFNFTEKELITFITETYKGVLKKKALTYLNTPTYLQNLMQDLLENLIITLNKYVETYKLKIINFKDLNFAIFGSPYLYPVFKSCLLPEKYLKVTKLQLINLPISLVLKELQKLKLKFTDDSIYFIRQYVVGNYLDLSDTDKLECGFATNEQDFFYQWFDLIKNKLQLVLKLTYKTTAELILSYDIFHECQEERERAYKDLLGQEISNDVVANILSGYIY